MGTGTPAAQQFAIRSEARQRNHFQTIKASATQIQKHLWRPAGPPCVTSGSASFTALLCYWLTRLLTHIFNPAKARLELEKLLFNPEFYFSRNMRSKQSLTLSLLRRSKLQLWLGVIPTLQLARVVSICLCSAFSDEQSTGVNASRCFKNLCFMLLSPELAENLPLAAVRSVPSRSYTVDQTSINWIFFSGADKR